MNAQPMQTSAVEFLRTRTAPCHRELDSDLAIGAPHPPTSVLRPFMRAMLSWLSAFESRLSSDFWLEVNGNTAGQNVSIRLQKCGWLIADLLMLGETETTLRQLPVPDLDLATDIESLIGYAYVIEGSQLGTRVLERHFAPLLLPQASLWLKGYGELTGPMWRECREMINRNLVTESQMETAAAAATYAFSSLHGWCRQQGATL